MEMCLVALNTKIWLAKACFKRKLLIRNFVSKLQLSHENIF